MSHCVATRCTWLTLDSTQECRAHGGNFAAQLRRASRPHPHRTPQTVSAHTRAHTHIHTHARTHRHTRTARTHARTHTHNAIRSKPKLQSSAALPRCLQGDGACVCAYACSGRVDARRRATHTGATWSQRVGLMCDRVREGVRRWGGGPEVPAIRAALRRAAPCPTASGAEQAKFACARADGPTANQNDRHHAAQKMGPT
jgi:hypothetical protein